MVSCTICYEKLGEPSPSDPQFTSHIDGPSHVSATDCGHLFHTSCITKWMSSGRSRILCPICKHSISPRRLTTIYQDWSTEPHHPSEPSKNHGPSTSTKPPGEESRLFASFAKMKDNCLALEMELEQCRAQLEEQRDLAADALSNCNDLNSRLTDSVANGIKLELLLTHQKKEKEKLASRINSLETQRNLDNQKITRLQMTVNQLKGLEIVASLGLDSETSSTKSAVEAYSNTGPREQLKLFKGLEYKSFKLLNERNQYFVLYKNIKKQHDSTINLLEAATQQNLKYEKQISSTTPLKKNVRAPPVSYSASSPKEPRVKLVNPFLKERNSGKKPESEPSSNNNSGDSGWSSINPKKRPRSPSILHNRTNSLGDQFNSLSLDSVIDLTNEEVENSPLKTTKSVVIDEIKPIRRNIHSFYT